MSRTVAIYARVSTEHEAQLSALENQVQYYDDILKKHPDWILYDRYIDEGITGTSIKKRKNFMRMIEDAKNKCFDLIITREVSRFARNTVDTLQETRRLKKLGVEVYFTEDNIWTFNDEDGELKLTIMATLAQNESKKTSQRVKAGQKISFQNGVFYGTGNILGYDKIGKEMIINEEQANIVKFIYSSFLSGNGTTKIKYELEKRGYLTATGLKIWSASNITRILHNPFYCGTIIYRKSFIPDFLEQKPKKNKGEVEKVVVEGTHQPIISKEDFNKVQQIFGERASKIEKDKSVGYGIPKNIWSKKLMCSCGSTFNRRTYHKKNDESITYCYHCYRKKNLGSSKTREKKGLPIDGTCDVSLIQEWKLNVMARALFEVIYTDKEQIINVINELIDNTINENNNYEEIQSKINSYLKKIEKEKNKIDKLLEMYLSDMIEKENYIKKKKELEELIKDQNIAIDELRQKQDISTETVADRIKNLKKNVLDNIRFDNENTISELVDSYIEKITIYNDRSEWILNYIDGIINLDIKGQERSSKKELYMTPLRKAFRSA